MNFRRCCLVVAVAFSCLASDDTHRSSVEGAVTLNSRSALPAVTIGIDSRGEGVHLETVTNTAGYYLFAEVKPGAYSMWADARGYGCILIPRVAVQYGQRVRRDFNFVRAQPREGCEPLTESQDK
ncbi:MAG: carboxypeptidase regulatory-like domain-containing protein [Acidobacteriaceae bacterium]|nr:carboxypeptidase regulatory-like domain-containing protein [Acidobacteriaceae bacterium]